MVTVRRTNDTLMHKGVKGMKWGYNDGSRNGRRTAAELKDVGKAFEKLKKNMEEADDFYPNTGDIETDYHEANNMLKYLGLTLDLQSDDDAVASAIHIYNTMKATKDNFKTQYDWLKAFSGRLAIAGYDMKAVDKMLDDNKSQLNTMKVGTGVGNQEKSNQDWQENTLKTKKPKKSSKKSSDTSTKKKSSKKKKSSSTSTPRKTNLDAKEETVKKNQSEAKHSYRIIQNGDELYHHGILGQKWGVRRFQNADGSLTSEGKKRYGSGSSSNYGVSKGRGKSAKVYSKRRASKMTDAELDAAANRLNKEANYKQASERLKKSKKDHTKSATDKLQNIALATTAIVTIAANYPKIVNAGKKAVDTVLKKM